jgi:hypothetical protein
VPAQAASFFVTHRPASLSPSASLIASSSSLVQTWSAIASAASRVDFARNDAVTPNAIVGDACRVVTDAPHVDFARNDAARVYFSCDDVACINVSRGDVACINVSRGNAARVYIKRVDVSCDNVSYNAFYVNWKGNVVIYNKVLPFVQIRFDFV